MPSLETQQQRFQSINLIIVCLGPSKIHQTVSLPPMSARSVTFAQGVPTPMLTPSNPLTLPSNHSEQSHTDNACQLTHAFIPTIPTLLMSTQLPKLPTHAFAPVRTQHRRHLTPTHACPYKDTHKQGSPLSYTVSRSILIAQPPWETNPGLGSHNFWGTAAGHPKTPCGRKGEVIPSAACVLSAFCILGGFILTHNHRIAS